MTIIEKAAYLKGMVDGLGMSADSREGKLWSALNELLSSMAHEIEDLRHRTCPTKPARRYAHRHS